MKSSGQPSSSLHLDVVVLQCFADPVHEAFTRHTIRQQYRIGYGLGV